MPRPVIVDNQIMDAECFRVFADDGFNMIDERVGRRFSKDGIDVFPQNFDTADKDKKRNGKSCDSV